MCLSILGGTLNPIFPLMKSYLLRYLLSYHRMFGFILLHRGEEYPISQDGFYVVLRDKTVNSIIHLNI